MVTEIENSKGLYDIRPMYIFRRFIELNSKVICLDNKERIVEVREMNKGKIVKSIIICKAKDLLKELNKQERN